ncbi:MAG: PLP-dependent aminotransferase family protein [Lachnospiraceae bacterium]|nr:PLP-dependent aminotransferase family protein [Lachnospiraceae bacterium]
MQDLQITLDKGSGRHLYEQIYRFIREAIRDGSLQTGERLPSTRILGRNLGVSRSTAQLAYDQLLAEGYIRSRRGSGYYVSAIDAMLDAGRDDVQAAVQTLPQTPSHGGSAAAPDAREKEVRIDFSPRLIEMGQFPYATWKRIHKGIFVGTRAELFRSGDAAGDPALRSTIAHYLHLSRGVKCTPDQVIVGAGNDYLMMLLGQILGRQVRIGMESPTYLRAGRIFDALGWDVRSVCMDREGMRADSLEAVMADRPDPERFQLAYVMPAHQFPVGTLMPVARRAQILRWAGEESRRYIIEDDYDSEFRYRGKPVPALQSQDGAGKVIYMGTFSKSIAPSIRISYMILPESLLCAYRERCYFYSGTVSRIDQAILHEFMADGYFERYLNRMRTLYRGRHDVLVQALRALEPRFKIRGAGAGLHVLLELTGTGRPYRPDEIEETEEALRLKAEEAGVRVYKLSVFRLPKGGFPAGQADVPGIVLGYGALAEEQIREGVGILREAWKDV